MIQGVVHYPFTWRTQTKHRDLRDSLDPVIDEVLEAARVRSAQLTVCDRVHDRAGVRTIFDALGIVERRSL